MMQISGEFLWKLCHFHRNPRKVLERQHSYPVELLLTSSGGVERLQYQVNWFRYPIQ